MTVAEVLALLDALLGRQTSSPQEPAGDPGRPAALPVQQDAPAEFERDEGRVP